MEPVLFYGVPEGSSFGSIVALEWLGQAYRLCRINLPGDAQGDLYARVNPVRKVPALLLENGARLSESAAILQHLGAREPNQGLSFAQGTHVQKLEADPAVVFAHAIEDERPAVSSGGFKGHVSLEDLKARLTS